MLQVLEEINIGTAKLMGLVLVAMVPVVCFLKLVTWLIAQ